MQIRSKLDDHYLIEKYIDHFENKKNNQIVVKFENILIEILDLFL